MEAVALQRNSAGAALFIFWPLQRAGGAMIKQKLSRGKARKRAERRARDKTAHVANPLRLYRPSRLAELFDVDESTIWRWRIKGVLPAFTQIGGIRGLTEQQVEQVLAQHREGSA